MFSPLDCAESVRSTLLGYLASALPIANRSDQRELGHCFQDRLASEKFRGPFVEAQPVYPEAGRVKDCLAHLGASGSTFAKLTDAAARTTRSELSAGAELAFRRVFKNDWPEDAVDIWRRPLYPHQERAFRLAASGRSLIVATGTGSGKTECYILPLLYLLASEEDGIRQRPGVRAILLFPMNALVEDQMRRLRSLLFFVNVASQMNGLLKRPITFGRYTGETPRNHADKDRPLPEEHIIEYGELLTRDEMYRSPPDILVTNFTMLEYALLRPADHRLFADPSAFRMLALDEVHTYSGTMGAEIAMLLRRLRAFMESAPSPPTRPPVLIGTSATLGSRKEHLEGMARFASDLFGQDVPPDHVVSGPPQAIASPPTCVIIPGGFAHEVAALVRRQLIQLVAGKIDIDDLADDNPSWPTEMANDVKTLAIASDGLWSEIDTEVHDHDKWSNDAEGYARYLLGRVFEKSKIFARLAHLAKGGNVRCPDIRVLTAELFGLQNREPSEEETTACEVMLAVASNAFVDSRAALPTRFHFFIGEQKDAWLCINPNCNAAEPKHDGWWSRLFLSHHNRCPTCDSVVFRIVLCRKCGFVLLEAWRPTAGALLPEPPPDVPCSRFLFRPYGATAPEEEGKAKRRRLCPKSGLWFECTDLGAKAEETHLSGCAAKIVNILEWSSSTGNVLLEECPECEQEWYKGEEVFTGVGVSHYGAATVLIEEIARRLRASKLPTKIISFSDSRQQAAKLAAKLQRTNRDFVFRQILWHAIYTQKTPAVTTELLNEIFSYVDTDQRLRRLFAPDAGSVGDDVTIRKSIGELLFREAVSAYRSLESIGLVVPQIPDALAALAPRLWLPAQFEASDDGKTRESVLRAILDLGLRFRQCISSAYGAVPTAEDRLQRWRIFRKWVPAQGAPRDAEVTAALFLRVTSSRNRLFNLLRRASGRAGRDLDLDSFNRIIASLWSAIFANQGLLTTGRQPRERDRPIVTSTLVDANNARIQLNINVIRWTPVTDATVLFRCDACGCITSLSVAGACPVRDCSGTLRSVSPSDLDADSSPVGHYRALVEREPTPLHVEEHTAEISMPRRIEIEREFRARDDDAVDVISGSTTFELGIDLGSINSVYMANLPPRLANYRQRAGRAGRASGASPLIVNYVRQRPHDQYFWRDISGFISGPVPPPKFKLSSEIVLERHGFSVLLAAALAMYDRERGAGGGLWGPGWADFCAFMYDNQAEKRRLQATQDACPEITRIFTDIGGALAKKLSCSRIAERFFERIEKARQIIASNVNDGVIEVLGDHGILPTYSFPIYVDELRLHKCRRETSPRRDLALTRDRRISLTEYQPGNVITAGGFEIRSVGIWAGYEPKSFKVCPRCNRAMPRPLAKPCGCGVPLEDMTAVIPKGGFYGEVTPEESPPEIEREMGATSTVEFDPATDPPPVERRAGEGLMVAFYEANLMNLARMRQFSPRIGGPRLLLQEAMETDVSWPGKRHNCLRLAPPPTNTTYHLLHEFTTDVIRLRFLDNEAGRRLLGSIDQTESRKIWATIGEALLAAAARFLDIDDVANAEMGITFRHSPAVMGNRELILYDTAPGGAGYASEIGENLQEVFAIALQILQGCDCGDSCYKCLRTYRNQHVHTDMDRKLVVTRLAEFNAANWSSAPHGRAARAN